jgi:hypothetical protein
VTNVFEARAARQLGDVVARIPEDAFFSVDAGEASFGGDDAVESASVFFLAGHGAHKRPRRFGRPGSLRRRAVGRTTGARHFRREPGFGGRGRPALAQVPKPFPPKRRSGDAD